MDTNYQSRFVGEDPMLLQIDAIQGFQLSAEIPRIGAWSDDSLKSKLRDRIYDKLRGVVKEAKFFHEYELAPGSSRDAVNVIFQDDIFDFSVECEDSRLVIKRRGSGMEAFYRWYSALMPSAGSIMNDTLSAITELTNRKLAFVRTSFRFNFIVFDLSPKHEDRLVKNVEVMQKLLRGFPDGRGSISSDPKNLHDVSRADFAVTRWIGKETARRQARYSVEAPANRVWSSLWFDFSYGTEAYTDPGSGERFDLEAEALFSEWEPALMSFLRDYALKEFMGSLLADYKFNLYLSWAALS